MFRFTILLICISTSLMGHNYQKNNANIEKSVTPGNFIEFLIEWRKPHRSKFVRLEMTSKTKLLLQVQNGEKNCILEFSRLWKTSIEGEWYSGAPRPENEAFTIASRCFQVGLETVQTSKVKNSCELITRSCRIMNAPYRRPSWKVSLTRCGRTPHHHTFNCFTKAYQGTWKLEMIPRKL